MELKITDLSKKFGDFTAVDNLNVTMTMGVYGLLGVNGAGKTTLMRMLCTLLKPTSGTIYCDGNDIFNMDGEYRKLLGYLPQEFGFYPEFTIKDYLLYIASLKGIRPIVAKKRVKELAIALIYVYKILLEDGRYCECKREFEMWLAHTIIQNTQIYCEQVVDTKVFKKYVGELVKLYYKGGI